MSEAGGAALRLVVVEDDDLYRNLLAVCLSRQPALFVVGSFADSDEALARIPELRPAAGILDIDLPGSMDGIELGLALRKQLPDLGIVLLSNHAIPQMLSALPEESVAGWSYLLKKSVSDVNALARAITGSVSGMVTLDPSLVAGLRPRENGRLAALTRRQREVLDLIAQGFTNAAIGEALVLSEKSVEKHVTSLYDALEIDRANAALTPRVEAVLMYLKETRSRWNAAVPGRGAAG
ncbi:MAG TPA: response regulator transcription factor [Chloroflexota bacterium]|nr:response regulator transcription factor [Chloroflexota bacterium]